MNQVKKRKVSVLIPYKKQGKDFFIYMQKRGMEAQGAPGKIGFFGGGLENNETAEQALIREIKEELDITPKDFWHLGDYELEKSILFAYCQEVGESFEKEIKVLEGDYGEWFGEEKIFSTQDYAEKFILNDKPVVIDFFEKVKIK